MEAFVAVVEGGNFRAAAEKLDVSSVMVGKHIRQMEEFLGTRLLHRTTRQQSLTEAGAAFYESAQAVLNQVQSAERSIESMQVAPKGMLRISAPMTLGTCSIAPILSAYLERYPLVQVELVLSNVRVDLVAEGFDIAIRIGSLEDSEFVARPIAPYRMNICAAPSYLAKRGTPETPADLVHHDCLGHLVWRGRNVWQLGDGREYAWPANSRLACNDGHALRAAAVEGAGVILQPEVLLKSDVDSGRLVPILQSFLPTSRPVNLIYLPDPRPRHKLASMVDFLLHELGAGQA
jgi:DNA-binding transcriptional LysR family regulator